MRYVGWGGVGVHRDIIRLMIVLADQQGVGAEGWATVVMRLGRKLMASSKCIGDDRRVL